MEKRGPKLVDPKWAPFPLTLKPLQGLGSSVRHLLDGVFAHLRDDLLDQLGHTADGGGDSDGANGLNHVGVEPVHTSVESEAKLLSFP